ncbi:MAG TPA: peptidase M20 [Clostridiales bacterium]|nr:peptidase M20 [Clostridiales bacterium]
MGFNFEFIDEEKLKQEVISIRREIHRYPESGWTEFRTSSVIIKKLTELDMEVLYGRKIHKEESMLGLPSKQKNDLCMQRAISEGGDPNLIMSMNGGFTGAIGILNGMMDGPTVALRFDIDANEIEESNFIKHKPYYEGFLSEHNGVMHSCGHDGHAAIGLGTAVILSKYKDRLKGRVIFIFQPAEEGDRGAKSIVDSGMLDNVDYCLGAHIGLKAKKYGTIVAGTDGFLASTKFDVTFSGKPSHAGANPELGENALLAAATAVLNLYSISRHSKGTTRINVGVLNAGTDRNIIPDKAFLKIETRGNDNELNEFMQTKAEKICRSAAQMYDIDYDIKIVGEAPTAVSDPEMIDIITKSALELNEVTELIPLISFGAGEDVTFMINEVQRQGGKASFMLLGSELASGHHTKEFDFNEDVLMLAAKVFSKVVIDILN